MDFRRRPLDCRGSSAALEAFHAHHGREQFPVRRAEKANASEHRRLEELLNCRKLWRKRILKAIVPNTDGPIMSGDAHLK